MKQVAIIGIGGYGAEHLKALRRMAGEGLCRFAAVAEADLGSHGKVAEELCDEGVEVYRNHGEMLASHPHLDLVTLPLPIMLHAPAAIECLGRGVNVLVEKPPAGCVADVQAMLSAEKDAGRLCGVSFQYSTSRMAHELCEMIAAGRLGRVTDVSALCLAQRPDSYYARASWAGKIEAAGRMVRDGSLNNPFAHMAQLLLTFAGAAESRVARPASVRAELYAGHEIASEDTSAVEAALDSRASLHFFASLCSREQVTTLRISGTGGTATLELAGHPECVVRLSGGAVETLAASSGAGGATEDVIRNFVEVLEGRASRLSCPLEDTVGFAELVEGAFEGGAIRHLHGTPWVRREEGPAPEGARTYIDGIEGVARQAFEEGRLFSQVGAPWAAGR